VRIKETGELRSPALTGVIHPTILLPLDWRQKLPAAQLRCVLAHELAHDDLGHVAKAQALGAGLNIGMVILDQIVPGSGALTPIAGGLIARAYSRNASGSASTASAPSAVSRSRRAAVRSLTPTGYVSV